MLKTPTVSQCLHQVRFIPDSIQSCGGHPSDFQVNSLLCSQCINMVPQYKHSTRSFSLYSLYVCGSPLKPHAGHGCTSLFTADSSELFFRNISPDIYNLGLVFVADNAESILDFEFAGVHALKDFAE